MEFLDKLCCCCDLTLGAVISGLYSCLLSLVFLALGIDNLVMAYKQVHHNREFVKMNIVYSLVIGLSLLYAIAAIGLVVGTLRRMRSYIIPWIPLTPMWTCIVIVYLVVLPTVVPSSIQLTDLPSRVTGTILIALLNFYSLLTVSYTLYLFCKTPRAKLKPVGVTEAIVTGLSSRKDKLTNHIDSTHSVHFNKKGSHTDNTHTSLDIPEIAISTINTDNSQYEVRRVGKYLRSAVTAAKERDQRVDDFYDVSPDMNSVLTSSQVLQHSSQHSGLDNPCFLED